VQESKQRLGGLVHSGHGGHDGSYKRPVVVVPPKGLPKPEGKGEGPLGR
jgi:hypothetical protein